MKILLFMLASANDSFLQSWRRFLDKLCHWPKMQLQRIWGRIIWKFSQISIIILTKNSNTLEMLKAWIRQHPENSAFNCRTFQFRNFKKIKQSASFDLKPKFFIFATYIRLLRKLTIFTFYDQPKMTNFLLFNILS